MILFCRKEKLVTNEQKSINRNNTYFNQANNKIKMVMEISIKKINSKQTVKTIQVKNQSKTHLKIPKFK